MTYTAKLVSLYLFGFAPFESSFIDEVWKLFLHEIVNDFDGFVKTFLASTGYMKVEWGVLRCDERLSLSMKSTITYRSRRHVFVRVVIASGGNILWKSKREALSTQSIYGRRRRTGASLIFDLEVTQPRSADATEGM